MELPTNPRAILGNRFPFFSRPKPIGFFSVDSRGKCTKDFSQLRYLNKIPSDEVNFDLNYNIFKDFIIKGCNDDTDLNEEIKNDADINEHIKIDADSNKDGKDDVEEVIIIEKLQFIKNHLKDHRETFDLFDESDIFLKDVPFICLRGFLSDVSGLPYNNLEPFRFSACLFRGVIYFYHLMTEKASTRVENLTVRDIAMTLWGYKFEQYLVSDDPHSNPDIESPLCDVRQFSCMLESRLNEHRLIYGTEMDGVLGEETSLTEKFQSDTHSLEFIIQELRKCQFVELKTNRLITAKKQEMSFRRHKTRSWWLQCYFAGIETLVCGFRDDDGVVRKVKRFKVSDIPKMNNDYWNPNICMNFCDEMLKYIKDCFAREISKIMPVGGVTNVRYLPKIELAFERLPMSNVRLTTAMPDENISILNDRFINMFPKVL